MECKQTLWSCPLNVPEGQAVLLWTTAANSPFLSLATDLLGSSNVGFRTVGIGLSKELPVPALGQANWPYKANYKELSKIPAL